MNSDRWQKIQQLFETALQKDPEERETFLKTECGDDMELYEEVMSLLMSDENSESMLDGAAIDAVKTIFFDDISGEFSVEGKQIGKYKLLKRIASGGMGTVYLAERTDGQFDHKVAVKLIKPGMDSEQIIRRFTNERQILANLDHPNIAKLLDGGLMKGNLPYFTMEYVEGEPIDSYCKKNNLSLKKRLKLFQTVCHAVQYAHRNLVIHRDLKPGNILVTADGAVKLLDFGIAKVFGTEKDVLPMTALTQPGLKVMTPEYASPEQIQGKTVTTSTDVYSLGLILYQLLTNSHPFDFAEKSPSQIEKMICEDPPSKPSTALSKHTESNEKQQVTVEKNIRNREKKIKKELKGDLDTICLKALRKEPERRYNSPQQLSEDINRYLSGRPINAMRDSLTYRSKKFIQRHKASVIAAIISFVIINTLVLYYTYQLAVEKNRAQLEAEKSAQVSDFLIKLFEVSDPSESRGQTITARELLDSGTERIESELSEQPKIQAELFNVVGKVYMSLGIYSKSQNLLEKALDLNREIYGEINSETAVSNDHLGTLFFFKGEYETSEKFHNNALKIYKKLPQVYAGDKAAAILNKALVVHEMGKYDLADSLYKESIRIRKSIFGEQSKEVAESIAGLARLLNDRADYTNSEKMYKKALEIRQHLFGDLHPSVTHTMTNLGYLYESLGKWTESEKLYRKALEIDKKLFGEEHPSINSDLFSLGTLLHNMGKYDEAEYYLRRAMKGDIKDLGKDHPYIALDKNNLAGVMNAKGDIDIAERLYKEALKMQKRILGDEHPEVATTTSNLSMVFLKKGQLDSAEIYCKRALDIRKKLLSDEHPHVSISMNHLANVYFKMKNYEKAGKLYKDALEMQQRLMGKENRLVVVPILSLAAFRFETGDTLEAEKLLLEAVRISKKSYPEGHPYISNTLFELGELLLDKKEYSKAEGYLQQSLDIRNNVYASNHKSVIEAKVQLGKCWIGMEQYSKAENLLLECFANVREGESKQRKEIVQSIMHLYRKWQKPKQADEFAIYISE